tara:strand:+ start:5950 stop:6252 length:303 start_codon:yes stop_codon:yes gene_type:complete
MEEKKYVNGIVIKEKVFDNGGSQLKMSVKVEDFVNQLKEISDKGWANLIISKRKEPSDTGVTHYVKVDTWKPDPNKATGQVNRKPQMATANTEDDSGLPF